TSDAIFERGQLLNTDRSARMHASRRDADLGTEAKLAAIGELRRGVVQDDGGVDLTQEAFRGCSILGNDAVGVVGTVCLGMLGRASVRAGSRLPAGRRRVGPPP